MPEASVIVSRASGLAKGERLRSTIDAIASRTPSVRHDVPNLSAMSATHGFGKCNALATPFACGQPGVPGFATQSVVVTELQSPLE